MRNSFSSFIHSFCVKVSCMPNPIFHFNLHYFLNYLFHKILLFENIRFCENIGWSNNVFNRAVEIEIVLLQRIAEEIVATVYLSYHFCRIKVEFCFPRHKFFLWHLSGELLRRFEDSLIVQELTQSVEDTEFVVFSRCTWKKREYAFFQFILLSIHFTTFFHIS